MVDCLFYHSLMQRMFLEHRPCAQAGVGEFEGGMSVWQIPQEQHLERRVNL